MARFTKKTKIKKRDNDGASENLEGTEVLAPADISHDSDSERPTKVVSRKHSVFTRFRRRSKLRSMFVKLKHKGSLQKTHWRSSTSSRKVW